MYALAPMVQVATTAHRTSRLAWRPAGFDLSAHNFVQLSVSGTRRALVWFDDPVVDARVVKVADGATEVLGTASRTALGTAIADRVLKSTFDATIVDVLKTPPLAWGLGRLRPETDAYRIWLGPGGRGKNLFGRIITSEPATLERKKTLRMVGLAMHLQIKRLTGAPAPWVASVGGGEAVV